MNLYSNICKQNLINVYESGLLTAVVPVNLLDEEICLLNILLDFSPNNLFYLFIYYGWGGGGICYDLR